MLPPKEFAAYEHILPKLFWPFHHQGAVTLWPFGIWYKASRATPAVRAHEHYHWEQQRRWKGVPWYLLYGLLMLRYGGGPKHPLEISPYRLQRELEAQGQG